MPEGACTQIRRYAAVQRQIEASQRQICGERTFRIDGRLKGYPLGTVKRLDHIIIDGECETDSITPTELILCQMEHNLSRSPLAWRVGLRPTARIPTSDEVGDAVRSGSQQGEGILQPHKVLVERRGEHLQERPFPPRRPPRPESFPAQ